MKCTVKKNELIRFDDLNIGDVFVEEDMDTPCIKIAPCYDENCDDADIIHAINLTDGTAWKIFFDDSVYKAKAELSVEY